MHVIDASGRRVSLLNDDTSPPTTHDYLSYQSECSSAAARYYPPAPPRTASTPNTPELLRSNSYDSHMSSAEPMTPMTPVTPVTPPYDAGRYPPLDARALYEDYYVEIQVHGSKRRPSARSDARSSADPDAPAPSERPGKRFPCRYRDTHGCQKTFTTSGHASRHSKIHTAEKAVPCTFAGCPKKFTRADNMKQHLETHYKEKSRTSSRAAGDRRSPASGKSSARSKAAAAAAAATAAGNTLRYACDMRDFTHPLLNRPSPAHSPSSGLDALAMAVACQEGTQGRFPTIALP